MEQVVCRKDDLHPGEIMEATLGQMSVVVCRASDGHFYAFANRCIHQGASLAQGKLCGAPAPTNTHGEYDYGREGEILRCPWHGREFDIKNEGRMLADPKRRLPQLKVKIEGNEVIVQKGRG